MTCRSRLIDFNEKCILIAVVKDFFYSLNMSGGFTFLPELLSRTAPKPGDVRFHCFSQRLGVHVRHHKNIKRNSILDHCRDEPFIVIFQVVGYLHKSVLTQSEKNVQRDKKETGSMKEPV